MIPEVTREWQDRQREQDLKQSLLTEISTSSTTAVTRGISFVDGNVLAAGGQAGEDKTEIYAILRNSWLIDRATTRSAILVYFPSLYGCWYSYERALSDYLGLAASARTPSAVAGRDARVRNLQRYVKADFANSYVDPGAPDGCAPLSKLPEVVQSRFLQLKGLTGWTALTFPVANPRFRGVYAILGEELEIAMERIVNTIVKTPAEGFSQGITHI